MAHIKHLFRRTLREEKAQETLEHIIVIGLVVVAMMVLLLDQTIGMPALIRVGAEAMCSTVDPVPPSSTDDCVVRSP